MIAQTEKYIFGGSCLSHLNGKAVFIPFSLPNEKLKIEIVKEKKDYINAKIIDIVAPSPYRILPKCPHFYSCGGCSLQMMCNEEQHKLRLESVKEIFTRTHIEIVSGIEFINGKDSRYRNRFQFQKDRSGISLMRKASSEAVPIKECPIAVKEIEEYISKNSIFDDNGQEGVCKERVHTFAFDGKVWQSTKDTDVHITLLGCDFTFSPSSFFQSNVEMLLRLVNVLKEHVGNPKRMLDFYAGVGTFSLFFAQSVDEVHLVEWCKDSLKYAKKNIAPYLENKRGFKCFFHAIKSQEWSKMEASKLFYDVAIVDPPRSGIDKNSLQWFCKKRVKKILYVSCDPVTFANNANVLIRDGGYMLKKCYLLDFYPQTHHVESLGIFSL